LATASRIGPEKLFALALLYGWFNQYKLQTDGDALIGKHVAEEAGRANLSEEPEGILKSLGNLLLTDRHELRASFLEKAAEKAVFYISATNRFFHRECKGEIILQKFQ